MKPVFILTAVDAGTRVGRFFLQEMLGKAMPKFNDKEWMPGIVITSAVFTFLWGYLVYTGNISTIWPLFGLSNQLLAACALIVCTTMLLRLNRGKYTLAVAIPGIFMVVVTFWAGYLQVFDNICQKTRICCYLRLHRHVPDDCRFGRRFPQVDSAYAD